MGSAATPAKPTRVGATSTGNDRGNTSGLKEISRYLTDGEVARIKRGLEARRARRAKAAG